MRILGALDEILLGNAVSAWKANESLARELDRAEVAHHRDDISTALPRNELNSELASSIARLDKLENKAVASMLGIAIGAALLGDVVTSLEDSLRGSSATMAIFAKCTLLAAVFYFLASGAFVLRVVAPSQVARPLPRDQLNEPAVEGAVILHCISQNNRKGTQKSNLLTVGIALLRNGIFALLAFSTILILKA